MDSQTPVDSLPMTPISSFEHDVVRIIEESRLSKESKDQILKPILFLLHERLLHLETLKTLLGAISEYMKIDASGTTESEESLADIMHRQHGILRAAVLFAQERKYCDERINYTYTIGDSITVIHMVDTQHSGKKETQ